MKKTPFIFVLILIIAFLFSLSINTPGASAGSKPKVNPFIVKYIYKIAFIKGVRVGESGVASIDYYCNAEMKDLGLFYESKGVISADSYNAMEPDLVRVCYIGFKRSGKNNGE